MTSATVSAEDWQAEAFAEIGPFVYRREDYVGTIRHLVIIAVDLAVILFVVFPLGFVPAFVAESLSIRSDSFLFVGPLFLTWLYLTVIKPSRIRSPGYWVTGSKIVTIYGKKPSTLRDVLFIDVFECAKGSKREARSFAVSECEKPTMSCLLFRHRICNPSTGKNRGRGEWIH